MTVRILFTFLLNMLLVNAFYGQEPVSANDTTTAGKKSKSAGEHYGIASFYADKFNGRHTANGDIFDQQKPTAACNILPLNIWVRVTNLRNNKTVEVKITDRMHHSNKRLIDLSKSAAKQLAYTGWGLAHVKVEVIRKTKPRTGQN